MCLMYLSCNILMHYFNHHDLCLYRATPVTSSHLSAATPSAHERTHTSIFIHDFFLNSVLAISNLILIFSFKWRFYYHCFFFMCPNFLGVVNPSLRRFPVLTTYILSLFLKNLFSSFIFFVFSLFIFCIQEEQPFCAVFACACMSFCWQLHLAFLVEFCKGR